MQYTKSHMLPKLIFANVLAVIMMTSEQQAPAGAGERTTSTLGQKAAQPAPVMQVAEKADPVAIPDKKVVKPRMHQAQKPERHVRPVLVKARQNALNCCFRGNLS